MMHTVAAVVLLLTGAVNGRRENIAVHSDLGKWSMPPEQLDATIANIYQVFEQRAKIAGASKNTDYTVAASMCAVFRATERFSEAKEGCSKGINRKGLDMLITLASKFTGHDQDEVFKQGVDELFVFLSDTHKSTGCIQSEYEMSNALTAGRVSAARTEVLKDVFVSVTGDVGTPLEKGMMPCKEFEKQGMFLSCVHGDCETKDETPVSFDEFKLYYNMLGMFIADDQQFQLMLVNAWHMIDAADQKDKYRGVNTVNLYLRCYTQDEVENGGDGTWLPLNPDCPSPRQEPAVATQMAIAQNPDANFVACEF